MQARSSLGCVPHTAWVEMLSVPPRRKPEGKSSFTSTSWPQLKQNSVDEASKWFYIFRGNKQLKSDTLCSIISPANMGKPKQGMQQHQAPLVSDVIIGALADQPVPLIPSLPIAPKYSPTQELSVSLVLTCCFSVTSPCLLQSGLLSQPVIHCSQGLLSNFDVEGLFLFTCNISSRYN